MSEYQNLDSSDTGMCSHGNLPNNCSACHEEKIKDDNLKDIKQLSHHESVIIKDKIRPYDGGQENSAQKKAEFNAIIDSGVDDCVRREIKFNNPEVDLSDVDYCFRIEGDIKDGVELKLGASFKNKSGKSLVEHNNNYYYRTGIKFNKDGNMRLEEGVVLIGLKPLVDKEQFEMIREFIEKDPISFNKLTSRDREVIKIVTEKKEFEDLKNKIKELSPEQLKELKETMNSAM